MYASLTQRVEGLRRACEQLPDGTPERAHVSQLIQQARRRFDLPEEISGQGSHQTTIQDAAAAADAVPAAVAAEVRCFGAQVELRRPARETGEIGGAWMARRGRVEMARREGVRRRGDGASRGRMQAPDGKSSSVTSSGTCH